MDLDRGAGLRLDRDQIPDELLPVVPYVEKWAFESLDDQDVFVAEMQEHRPEEVAEFSKIMDEYQEIIVGWGAGAAPAKHKSQMTDADWQHPYYAFLDAFKVREITGHWADDDDPKVVAMREEVAREHRLEQLAQAKTEADDAFRRGEYASYVSILEPFDDLLSDVQRKKMAIALKKQR